jgi:hypothetical protein
VLGKATNCAIILVKVGLTLEFFENPIVEKSLNALKAKV